MTLAQENIDQGSYNLALRRLAYILEHDPQNQEAQTLQKQAETELASLTAPLQAGGPTASAPTATPQPLPSPTPGLISDPQAELQRLRQLTTNGAWADALPALIAFQRQFPTVERQDTDRLLYDVYVNYGLTLLEGSQAELGLFYLEQAEKLGDLSQEVLDYRLWAELYLQGIAFYGVNWDVATYYFRELCVSAPFYQSACERLNQSLINFGDQYAGALDFCPAQELYQEALGYGRSQALVEKINQAGEACLLATPTPTAPITGTLPITGTVPLTDTNALPGSSFILPTPTTDSNQ
jgi:tetratricopeptide (TPR) repeat protein